MNPFTHKPDGSARHPATAGVLRHFRYDHLPERLQAISNLRGAAAPQVVAMGLERWDEATQSWLD